MKNNQNLFFSPEEKGRAFSDVLKEVQEYISSKYSTLMVEGGSEEVKQQVKRYITKYICDYRITVKGKTQEQLIDDLYTEMAEFSFITKYIFGTGIEEIDINSWRDIEIPVSYTHLDVYKRQGTHRLWKGTTMWILHRCRRRWLTSAGWWTNCRCRGRLSI